MVIKEDKPIDKLFMDKKSKYFLGAIPTNDFKLEHPSISKIHACLFFSLKRELMLVDLGSSHGTSVVREGKTIKLEELMPVALEKGDLLVFGLSSRKYRVELDSGKSRPASTDRLREERGSKGKEKSRSRSRSPPRKSRP